MHKTKKYFFINKCIYFLPIIKQNYIQNHSIADFELLEFYFQKAYDSSQYVKNYKKVSLKSVHMFPLWEVHKIMSITPLKQILFPRGLRQFEVGVNRLKHIKHRKTFHRKQCTFFPWKAQKTHICECSRQTY